MCLPVSLREHQLDGGSKLKLIISKSKVAKAPNVIKADDNPGPGSYEYDPLKTKIGAKFTKSKRKDEFKHVSADVPGPGAYQQTRENLKPTSPRFTY